MFNEVLKELKVLVVDDDKDVVEIIQHGLRQKEINVIAAYSFDRAKERILEEDFDVVIVDLNLAPEKGINISRFFPITRIIFITGYAEEKKKLVKEGYFTIKVLDKPVAINSLLYSIYEIVEMQTNKFCSDIFCKMLEKVKYHDICLDRIDSSIMALQTTYSGLGVSYKALFEDIQSLEKTLGARDQKVFNSIDKLKNTFLRLEKRVDIVLLNGNKNNGNKGESKNKSKDKSKNKKAGKAK